MTRPDAPRVTVHPPRRAPRTTTAVLAIVVVLAGLGARAALPPDVGGPAGDALYATLVVLLVALLVPRPWAAAAVGLVVCAGVEAFQLTDVPSRAAEAFPPVRYVLGTTFFLPDLGWYALGALIGGAVLALTASRAGRSRGAGSEHRHARGLEARRGRAARVVVAVVILAGVVVGVGMLARSVSSGTDALAADVDTAQMTLSGSAGRVADESVRDALAGSIADARTVLAATPLLERSPRAATRARERLESHEAAVDASRQEFARAAALEQRKQLQGAARRGSAVLTATKDLGAPQESRSALRSALDDADASLAAAGADALDGTGYTQIEAATEDLGERRSAVKRATKDLMTAQDAVTCPEPDQVWFPQAGRLDADDLAPIPWAPQYAVRSDVLKDLEELDAAYRRQFGSHLTINSAYRTYAQQVAVYNPANPNPLAAPPGCSNHGLGTAVDLGGGVQAFGSAQYEWLKAHAGDHGWTHPDWAEPDGRLPEPWHWQSVTTPTTY